MLDTNVLVAAFTTRGLCQDVLQIVLAEHKLLVGESEERVLIATGRYIAEGFDDARLDTLFLAMPIS